MSAPRLVLATRNEHKVTELVRLLRPSVPGLGETDVVPVSRLASLGLPEVGEVAETGVTFAENALLKARAVAAATGLPAVADDSGLCVRVLGGAPGVFSARWAGAHGDDGANLRLLLDQLADVPDPHRTAWFECAAAFVDPRPGTAPVDREVVVHGRLAGTLAAAPRGGNGFGYDPVLVPDGGSRTCAELTPQEKDAISHRGQAMRALAPVLVRTLSTG
ncbi:RdgB/HAM1 family non-canonical purine NTP pyrophosphatase [Aquipuribacter sp. MA13-6]|uniref:RdgB/HAM1 family non-canonical purine NTP pyrophosphatase n=1 Tax=unclassified Aquipuribacter TaxID=2635084 RepID=UPI003EEBD825